MSSEVIGGLVVAILSLSLLLSVTLYYMDNRKEKKRVRAERKGGRK